MGVDKDLQWVVLDWLICSGNLVKCLSFECDFFLGYGRRNGIEIGGGKVVI